MTNEEYIVYPRFTLYPQAFQFIECIQQATMKFKDISFAIPRLSAGFPVSKYYDISNIPYIMDPTSMFQKANTLCKLDVLGLLDACV